MERKTLGGNKKKFNFPLWKIRTEGNIKELRNNIKKVHEFK